MPILEVELVGGVPEPARRDLARRLADSAATVFGSAPGSTWVRVREVATADYSENGEEAGASNPRPVFVRVLKRSLSTGPSLEREVAALTSAVAEICERPADQVHLLYEPPAAGRVAFGGKLVT